MSVERVPVVSTDDYGHEWEVYGVPYRRPSARGRRWELWQGDGWELALIGPDGDPLRSFRCSAFSVGQQLAHELDSMFANISRPDKA